MLYAIFAVLVIILDQGVKLMVSDVIHMEAGETLIPGVLSLVNVHNDGAAFGFLAGSNARIFFIVLTGVFTLAVIIALATKFISGPLARWSIVLVTAGGLSNCIDRVIYGYVLDMFKFEPMPNFPVFNVADVFITVFALLFVLAIIFEKDRRSEDDFLDDEFDEDEDDYDEEDEEEKPSRRPARKQRPSRRRSRYEDEDEDEDDEEDEDEDDEEEPVRPARRSAFARRPRYEEEEGEDEEPAPRAAAAAKTAAPRTSRYDAEVEELRARRAAAQRQAAANRAGVTYAEAPSPAPAPVAEKPAPAPVVPAAPAPAPVKPTPAPAKPAAPAKAPAAEEEFSLEDILAEFK